MATPKVLAVARSHTEETIAAQVPDGQSELCVVVVSAARVVVTRGLRTYLQALLGFLGATAIGVIPTDPVAPPEAWQRLVFAAGLALWPAVISVLQNVLELLGRVDVTRPELRG